MDKRSSSLPSVALAGAALAVIILGQGARVHAAESASAPEEHAPPRSAPKKQAAAPGASHGAAASAVDEPYRCHPMEDISCTVVRETLQGTLIVSLRSGTAQTPSWTVISGAPPTMGPHPGGTVYVVPTVNPADSLAGSHQAALMPANGAPILE